MATVFEIFVPFGHECDRAARQRGVLALALLAATLAHVSPATAGDAPTSRRFEDTARWSAVFDDPARDEWQKPQAIIRALELTPDATVADIGAGTGYFTARLARAVPNGRVFAADTESAMVEHMRERFSREGTTNVEVIQATRHSPNLPIPVDAVLLVNVQSLVVSPGDYFSRLKDRLKPGARVAIVSTRPDAERGAIRSMRRPPEHVTREMARQGFKLHVEHDFLPHQYFLIFKATDGTAGGSR